MPIQIQLRRGTAVEWIADNPTLAVGEIGLETDTKYFKVGNGSSPWNSLDYGGIQGQPGSMTVDMNPLFAVWSP